MGELSVVSWFSTKVTACSGSIPANPQWSNCDMSQRLELLHIACNIKREEKSKVQERPFMPESETHQFKVFGLPSKYSPTANLPRMAFEFRNLLTNSTAIPL